RRARFGWALLGWASYRRAPCRRRALGGARLQPVQRRLQRAQVQIVWCGQQELVPAPAVPQQGPGPVTGEQPESLEERGARRVPPRPGPAARRVLCPACWTGYGVPLEPR